MITAGTRPAAPAQDVPGCDGVLDVRGSLNVAGDVSEGSHITVAADLTVGGEVRRSRLDAGGAVTLTRPCVGATIRAGLRHPARARLLAALDGADGGMRDTAAMAAQLVASGAATGRPVLFEQALGTVLHLRSAHVVTALLHAADVLAEEGADLDPLFAEAVSVARRACDARVPESDFASATARLGDAIARLSALAADPPRVEAAFLHSCTVRSAGDLVLTGAGIYDVDAVVGRDLVAREPGSTVRGGTFTVSGTVVVNELGGPSGGRTRVVLEGDDTGERLTAATAHEGVEIHHAGREIALTTGTRSLVVRVGRGGIETTGDPL